MSRRGTEVGGLPATAMELDALRDRCKTLVAWRASFSAAAGAIPFPGLDLAADAWNYATLLPKITRRFGLASDQIDALEPELQSVITAAAGKFTETLVARAVTPKVVVAVLQRFGRRLTVKEASKFVPVVGTITAGAVSYGMMAWFGYKHVDECHAVASAALNARLTGPDREPGAAAPAATPAADV